MDASEYKLFCDIHETQKETLKELESINESIDELNSNFRELLDLLGEKFDNIVGVLKNEK